MTIDKLTEQQTLDIAQRGQQLLADSAFRRACNLVAEMYWVEWRESAPADAEGRERLYQKAVVLDDVITALAKVVGDGKITADVAKRAKAAPLR